MTIFAIVVLMVFVVLVAGGAAVWVNLPKSDCVQNCCDNHSCNAPAATTP